MRAVFLRCLASGLLGVWTFATGPFLSVARAQSGIEAGTPASGAPADDAQPTPSEAAPVDVEAAFRALVAEALREYDAGNWSEARALFQRAYELVPSAEALRMMGNASYELRQYARAVDLLERALSDATRPLRPERAVEANDALERARRFVAVVSLELVPADLTLEIDLTPIRARADGTILLDPGTHRFVARAPGFQPRELDVELRAGDRHRFVVTLVPEPSRTWDARPTPEPTPPPVVVAPPAPPPPPRLDLAPFLMAQGDARRARMSLRASRVGLVMSVAMLAVGGIVAGISGRTDGLSPTFLGGDCRYQCRWSGGSVLGLTFTVAGGLGSVTSLVTWLVRRSTARRLEARARALEVDVRREADAITRPLELAPTPASSTPSSSTPSSNAPPSNAPSSPSSTAPSSSTPSSSTPPSSTPSSSTSSSNVPSSAAGHATLTLDAQPWCRVSVDGEAVGQTPIVAIPIRVGARVVTCTNPELGVGRELRLEVREGEQIRQRIRLP